MFEALKNEKRLLIEANLTPIQGERFQPTGFADLGAATYQLADGTDMLLVESAQSVANRLEATIVGPDNELIDDLKGLSYIRAQLKGESDATVNSLTEAHRINSPFIISDKDFQKAFTTEAEYAKGKTLNWHKIAKVLFKYDINSVLHGVFMANIEGGRIKLPRAISGFIEARNVREVVSGGVKNNPIDPSGKIRAAQNKSDVYGNVPYQRIEYTAETITAFFNLDLGLLTSHNLGDNAFELLVGLALYKVTHFVKTGLRLRTACDFMVKDDVVVTAPNGFTLPDEVALLSHIQQKISDCANLFAQPAVTELTTKTVGKKDKNDKD